MAGKCRFIVALIAVFLTVSLLEPIKIFSDEKAINLQSVILEDFELNAEGKPKRLWIAEPNRFGKEENLESGKSLQKVAWVQAWPEAFFGKEGVFNDGYGDKPYKTSLGIQIFFNRQGYNMVELYPVELIDGKYVKTPIQFQGWVNQLDMWIWAANYNYYMEMVLLDPKGFEHRISIGGIQHKGWKNFTIKMPNHISQDAVQGTTVKRLSLVKIIIGTNPSEKVSGTFVYIDHIKYLTDLMETKYDGYNLENNEVVKNIWDKAPKAPSETEIKP